MLYLAYGSNLNTRQMAVRCPSAQRIGPAVLKGYALVFRGPNGMAVATVEKKAGSEVPVLIWELDEMAEKRLDRYEGFPRMYGKESLSVGLAGKSETVMAYIMTEGEPLGMPGRHYYEDILEGYWEAGFDQGILDRAVRTSDPNGES